MRTVCNDVEKWFPDECGRVEKRGPDGKRRTKVVQLAIRTLETEVVDAMREALHKFGLQGDALVDAGLLVRTAQAGATPLTQVIPALEAEVLSLTGARVRLRAKKLDGEAAQNWAGTQIAQESPVSGHDTHKPSEKRGEWIGGP